MAVHRHGRARERILAVLMDMCMVVNENALHHGMEAEEYQMFVEGLRMKLNQGKQLGAKRYYIAGDCIVENGRRIRRWRHGHVWPSQLETSRKRRCCDE